MIVLVTGHPRSGTSMMMQALQAGGWPVVHCEARSRRMAALNEQKSGLNPHGLFELRLDQLKTKEPADFDGKAIKVVWPWLGYVKPFAPGYFVIQMERDPEEIRQSFEASLVHHRTAIHRTYPIHRAYWLNWLTGRQDVLHVERLGYRDVIEQPMEQFADLATWLQGFDPVAASRVIDPQLYRFRREWLVEGA